METLGPVELLAIDIPLLSTAENYLADLILGEEVEAVRQWVTDVEFREEYFEQLCEAL